MVNYFELFSKHDDYLSNKWENYLFIYNELLQPYVQKNEPLSLLEIGVQNGGSLQIWEKFLPKGSQIYGVDIDPKCAELKFGENTHFYLGDGSDGAFWKQNMQDISFDIIIDDASHFNNSIVQTFDLLFIEKLKQGGDLYCRRFAYKLLG